MHYNLIFIFLNIYKEEKNLFSEFSAFLWIIFGTFSQSNGQDRNFQLSRTSFAIDLFRVREKIFGIVKFELFNKSPSQNFFIILIEPFKR